MRFLFSLVILISLATFEAGATHLAGGTIRYEYVSDSVYDVYFEYYRKCDGVELDNPSSGARVYCASTGWGTTLSLTLQSIEDISFLCTSATKPCNPPNKRTNNGLEKHIYKTQVDLRLPKFQVVLSCGELAFESFICCRNGNITTGSASSDFYIRSKFNVSKAPKNTAPEFKENPINKLCCTRRVNVNFAVKDADGDSLSYHLTSALESRNTKVVYGMGYSYLRPLSYFGPWYFENDYGLLSFVPSKCGEVGPIAVLVKEWRKDSAGKYEEIGSIMREVNASVVSCKANYTPVLSDNVFYGVCEGEEIKFTIKSYDKPYSPSSPIDTVRITWDGGIEDGKFEIIEDTSTIHETAEFTWKPKHTDVASSPHSFRVIANDNYCPTPGTAYQKYTVHVYPKPTPKTRIENPFCGVYNIRLNYDTSIHRLPRILWQVLDTSGKSIEDSTIINFASTGSYRGISSDDKITVFEPGRYYLIGEASEETVFCSVQTIDTIETTGVLDLVREKDSVFCFKEPFRIKITETPLSVLDSFEWHRNNSLVETESYTDSLSGGISELYVEALHDFGCRVVDSISLKTAYEPLLLDIRDTVECLNSDQILFVAKNLLDSGRLITKYVWSTGGETDSIAIDTNGAFEVTASNKCGHDTDSFNVFFDGPYEVDLGDRYLLCDKDSFLIGDLVPRVNANYLWNTGEVSSFIYAKTTDSFSVSVYHPCGDSRDSIYLYFDETPVKPGWPDTTLYCDEIYDVYDAGNAGASYKWSDQSEGKTIEITEPGLFWVEISSHHCGSERDSAFARLVKSPEVGLGPDRIMSKPFSIILPVPQQEVNYLWSTGDTIRAIVVNDFGTYWVRVSNDCGSISDSINVTWSMGAQQTSKSSDFVKPTPNPNDGSFVLIPNFREITSVQIIDAMGRNVEFDILGSVVPLIEIERPAPGVYFVIVEQDNQLAAFKILVK